MPHELPMGISGGISPAGGSYAGSTAAAVRSILTLHYRDVVSRERMAINAVSLARIEGRKAISCQDMLFIAEGSEMLEVCADPVIAKMMSIPPVRNSPD